MVAEPPRSDQGLHVVAHAPEGFHLVRDGFFGAWAHVHLAEDHVGGGAPELHLECEHPLSEVLASTPPERRASPVLAHANLVGTLAHDAQVELTKPATGPGGDLRALPATELESLVGPASEAAETLSA
ncbi:MAG: hypothetical protein ACRDZQ_16225, partial [Acidimicrobiales bacterium]